MINYRVADLHALLAQLLREGIAVDDKIEESEYWKVRLDYGSGRKPHRTLGAAGRQVGAAQLNLVSVSALWPLLRGRLREFCQPRCNRLFGLRANNAIDQRAVFENEHGRNTLNLKLARCARVIVDVEFGDQILPI